MSDRKRGTLEGNEAIGVKSNELLLAKAEIMKLKSDNAEMLQQMEEMQQTINFLNTKVKDMDELNKRQRSEHEHEIECKDSDIKELPAQLDQIKNENSILIDEVKILDSIALGDKTNYTSEDERLEEAVHEITQKYSAKAEQNAKCKHPSSIVRGIK